jgi:hypothetical protein
MSSRAAGSVGWSTEMAEEVLDRLEIVCDVLDGLASKGEPKRTVWTCDERITSRP